MCHTSARGCRGSCAGGFGDGAAWWRWRGTGKSAREEKEWRLALRGGLFRIQPTRKKHMDRVFFSSACEPLDLACEPLDQACRCRLASTNQEEAHGSCVSFKRL